MCYYARDMFQRTDTHGYSTAVDVMIHAVVDEFVRGLIETPCGIVSLQDP